MYPTRAPKERRMSSMYEKSDKKLHGNIEELKKILFIKTCIVVESDCIVVDSDCIVVESDCIVVESDCIVVESDGIVVKSECIFNRSIIPTRHCLIS